MKRILLDTHIFLWWLDDGLVKNIDSEVFSLIANPKNEVYVSVASLWEINIKKSIGSLIAPSDLEDIIEKKGFSMLAIKPFHTDQVGSMPYVNYPDKDKLHRDPFDRMLVVQAQAEGMHLVSSDKVFPQYPVRLIKN